MDSLYPIYKVINRHKINSDCILEMVDRIISDINYFGYYLSANKKGDLINEGPDLTNIINSFVIITNNGFNKIYGKLENIEDKLDIISGYIKSSENSDEMIDVSDTTSLTDILTCMNRIEESLYYALLQLYSKSGSLGTSSESEESQKNVEVNQSFDIMDEITSSVGEVGLSFASETKGLSLLALVPNLLIKLFEYGIIPEPKTLADEFDKYNKEFEIVTHIPISEEEEENSPASFPIFFSKGGKDYVYIPNDPYSKEEINYKTKEYLEKISSTYNPPPSLATQLEESKYFLENDDIKSDDIKSVDNKLEVSKVGLTPYMIDQLDKFQLSLDFVNKGILDASTIPSISELTSICPLFINDSNKVEVIIDRDITSQLKSNTDNEDSKILGYYPTASTISITFGDVHENADVDQIIKIIEERLKSESNSTPMGVYGE